LSPSGIGARDGVTIFSEPLIGPPITLRVMTRSARAVGRRSLRLTLAAVFAAGFLPASARAANPVSPGTWTKAPANTATGGQAFGLWLLTDGTVLSHGRALNNWVILTPDAKGSYANGTWKSVASSAYARGGAQEHILKDGRFFEAGGEYIYVYPGCASNCSQPPSGSPLFKNVEIFDPVANTWTVEAPGLFDIGDTGSATLGDGRILDSTRSSSQTQIYDPSNNMWTAGPSIPTGSGDENAWASLQNGGVLAVGYATAGASVYDPAANKWTKTQVPSGFNTGDTGGISLMFDGRVFVYGLAGTSYIYTPGATASDAGSWAVGPAMLDGDEAEDEYSDTLPNGMVMGALVQKTYGPGVILQEFDPTSNTTISVQPPPDTGNPYPIDYLNLPNGQVMVTAGNADWLLTPSGAPHDAWRPTVTSVVFDAGSTYTLTGTQLSGLISGGDEGDDMTMAENYPIVWLTDSSGNVYYCRSFNFSSMMPSAGSSPETCQFTTPANLPAGTYDLYVSAVGVPSKNPFSFTTGKSSSVDAGAAPSDSGSSTANDAATSGDGAQSGGAGSDAGTGASSGSSGGASGSSGEDAGTTGASSSGGSTGTSSGASGASSGSNAASSGPASDHAGCGCRAAGLGSRFSPWLMLAGVALGFGRRLRTRGAGPSRTGGQNTGRTSRKRTA
jgi:hypothetical protein